MQVPSSSSPANLLRFEAVAWTDGYRRVVGIDEAGRGPIAGPVVAAAVMLPVECAIPDVNDSKALTAAQRCDLMDELLSIGGIGMAVADVPSDAIDRMNILRATYAAMQAAVAQLDPQPDFALVDGRPGLRLEIPLRSIIKGDARSASIAAASIVAKVTRDRMMQEFDCIYPGYGFAIHKGYATRDHLDALRRLGPSPIHRTSFAPVARVVCGALTQLEFDFSETHE